MSNYFDINSLIKGAETKQCCVTISKRGTGKLSACAVSGNPENGLVDQTSVIDTTPFRKKYSIDENGKFGHYKSGKCEICGKETTQVDADLLWCGLPTYLCSDKCHSEYWSGLVDQTKED